MNYSKMKYEGVIKNLISDSLLNWIGKGLPEELEYRIWFSKRLDFYKNRIYNNIIKKKPNFKQDVYQLIQEEVDAIKETDYEKETQNHRMDNHS